MLPWPITEPRPRVPAIARRALDRIGLDVPPTGTRINGKVADEAIKCLPFEDREIIKQNLRIWNLIP